MSYFLPPNYLSRMSRWIEKMKNTNCNGEKTQHNKPDKTLTAFDM